MVTRRLRGTLGGDGDSFQLDVLVNSAASFRQVPLMDVDAEEWDSVMALNVRAPHLLTRACATMLRAAAEGRRCGAQSAPHPPTQWVTRPPTRVRSLNS